MSADAALVAAIRDAALAAPDVVALIADRFYDDPPTSACLKARS